MYAHECYIEHMIFILESVLHTFTVIFNPSGQIDGTHHTVRYTVVPCNSIEIHLKPSSATDVFSFGFGAISYGKFILLEPFFSLLLFLSLHRVFLRRLLWLLLSTFHDFHCVSVLMCNNMLKCLYITFAYIWLPFSLSPSHFFVLH